MCSCTVQAYGEFELLVFGDDVILNQPVEDWPLCDALLSWHSDGFPLRKARLQCNSLAEMRMHVATGLHTCSRCQDIWWGHNDRAEACAGSHTACMPLFIVLMHGSGTEWTASPERSACVHLHKSPSAASCRRNSTRPCANRTSSMISMNRTRCWIGDMCTSA